MGSREGVAAPREAFRKARGGPPKRGETLVKGEERAVEKLERLAKTGR
jgi:hypothetical protein